MKFDRIELENPLSFYCCFGLELLKIFSLFEYKRPLVERIKKLTTNSNIFRQLPNAIGLKMNQELLNKHIVSHDRLFSEEVRNLILEIARARNNREIIDNISEFLPISRRSEGLFSMIASHFEICIMIFDKDNNTRKIYSELDSCMSLSLGIDSSNVFYRITHKKEEEFMRTKNENLLKIYPFNFDRTIHGITNELLLQNTISEFRADLSAHMKEIPRNVLEHISQAICINQEYNSINSKCFDLGECRHGYSYLINLNSCRRNHCKLCLREPIDNKCPCGAPINDQDLDAINQD